MKPLIVIPAREGSVRLPKKNIKSLNGIPLIQYTIEAAREVFKDPLICVSTDSEEIKQISEKIGLKVPFIRPKDLATNTADSRSVLLHAFEYYKNEKNYEADFIILLQPTSPLRNANHIKEAFELYNKNIDMVVSVKKTKSNPYFVLFNENKKGFLEKIKKANFTRSQDCPDIWEINGAIYIINIKSLICNEINQFKKIKKYEMNEINSWDIDDIHDFNYVNYLLENNII